MGAMKGMGIFFITIGIIIVLISGLSIQSKDAKNKFHAECEPTNLYLMQYKGGLARIYDCPESFNEKEYAQ